MGLGGLPVRVHDRARLDREPPRVPGRTGPGARLILVAERVYLALPARTVAEALLVRDGKVVAVGAADELRAAHPEEEVRRLPGVALPGFVDTHVHLASSAVERRGLDLSSAATWAGLRRRIVSATVEQGWIQGGGWALELVDDPAALDAWRPDVPAALASVDGHALWVNAAARAAAGQPGPACVLHEDAMAPILALLPSPAITTWTDALAEARDDALRLGITTILDPAVDADAAEAYARVGAPLRVLAATVVEPGDPAPATPYAKLYLDGVLESGTAALLAPYADGSNAPLRFTDAELRDVLTRLRDAGVKVHAHAIGDGAIHQLLDAIEATGTRGAVAAHVQMVAPADVPRFASLGVAASVTALWAWPDPVIRDLTWPRLDPVRNARLYPFGELARAGATLLGGSDWSVSSLDPLESIEVGVTRRRPGGPGARLAPDQAVDLATMWAAYTTSAGRFLDDPALGCLAPGCHADLAVFARDPFEAPIGTISALHVRETWIAGTPVSPPPPG